MTVVKIGYPVALTVGFQAFDGKMFKTKVWCKAYEKELIERRESAKK